MYAMLDFGDLIISRRAEFSRIKKYYKGKEVLDDRFTSSLWNVLDVFFSGHIPDELFYNRRTLIGVKIPNGTLTIGTNAFRYCTDLVNVEIPLSVNCIGQDAFYGCTSIKEIEIPNSVEIIKDRAFYQCRNLSTIIIPSSVNKIGDGVFYDCTRLKVISVEKNNLEFCSIDGVLFEKDMKTLVCYPKGKEDASYTIPNGVIDIEDFAFARCEELTSVEISESVANIGYGAFEECENLITAIIPDNVISIGSSAFENCINLKSIIWCGKVYTEKTKFNIAIKNAGIATGDVWM